MRYRNGEFGAAEALIAEALMLAPQSAELWSNRGTLQAALNNREAALVSFNRALQLKPGFPGATANRANILFELRRFADAMPDYERLLQTDPQYAYALGNLVFCKLQCCDWRDLERWRQRVLAALHEGKRAVPPVLSLALLDSLADQRRAAEIMAHDKLVSGTALWRGERYKHERIRLAYLSADFHSHATAVLAAGLFESHDRSRFETIAISFGPDDATPMRARLKRGFERFIDVRAKSDGEIARLVRELEVDIAVDLKGYTSDARPAVFSQRPAPIQVNYLGFPGTMGAPFMDYLIADQVVISEKHKSLYSEQIVWLPDTYQPNDRSRGTGAPVERAGVGLPEQGFVFCCFNNSYKIQPPIFDIWMRLLREVAGSVLWLLEDNPAATQNLKREAASRGIDPRRLVFGGRYGQPEHLARHSQADLFLDTLPYNAHTTASDALWTGLPIVTCTGSTFAGRVASSLLMAIGLPELVTGTLQEYEALALRLAGDPSALAAIRSKLSGNRETMPLFDIGHFARYLETAYATMYERHMRGLPQGGFAVMEPK
jgi:predicted O-linked N-acetylglucosamine transferase (SPINDLY family)